MALGETGIMGGIQDSTDPDWFVGQMIEPMTQSKTCKHLAYLLTYTNYPDVDGIQFWVPLPGDKLYPGFLEMYKNTHSIFLGDKRWQDTLYYTTSNSTCCGGTSFTKMGHSGKAKFWPLGDK